MVKVMAVGLPGPLLRHTSGTDWRNTFDLSPGPELSKLPTTFASHENVRLREARSNGHSRAASLFMLDL